MHRSRREFIKNKLMLMVSGRASKPVAGEFEAMVDAFEIALEGVTIPQIERGTVKVLQRPQKFMIDHGGFREVCLSGEFPDYEAQASAAWADILRRLDVYRTPVFADPHAARAVQWMGGWKSICGMRVDEVPHRRKEFLAHYQAVKAEQLEGPVMIAGGALEVYHLPVGGEDLGELKFIGFSGPEEIKAAREMIQGAPGRMLLQEPDNDQ